MSLRIVFAGTPQFAVPSLQQLIDSEHAVAGVLTQPDRRRGRGRIHTPPEVKSLALAHNLPVMQPQRLSREVTAAIAGLKPELMVVAAYGLLIPKEILALPRLGCVNVHASLLPRWRGAAPVARAIQWGDSVTGISIMQLDAGLDSGPVYSMRRCPIESEDTAQSLQRKLAVLGAAELIAVIKQMQSSSIAPCPQDDSKATYAPKLKSAEAPIDWHLSAEQIQRKIRALNPWPVAHSWIAGERVRIWQAQLHEDASLQGKPGQIVLQDRQTLVVMTGAGALAIKSLQKEGKRRLAARDFLAGSPLKPGGVFGLR